MCVRVEGGVEGKEDVGIARSYAKLRQAAAASFDQYHIFPRPFKTTLRQE